MSDPPPHALERPTSLVFVAGFVAGALDILYACLFWYFKAGTSPQRIFQSVAAGLLGKASFAGGVPTAALGLALHLGIALAMAATYYFVARRWAWLPRQPLLAGALYGGLLYVIMNFVVLPLSAAGRGTQDPLWVVLSIAAHVFLVGLPIGLLAGRAARA